MASTNRNLKNGGQVSKNINDYSISISNSKINKQTMIILLRNSMTLDNNNKCGWSKALDTVNHNILFRKLYELEAVCIFG